MPIAEGIKKGFSEDNLPLLIKTGILILGFFLAAIVVSRIVYPFDLGHLEAFSWMPATHLLEGKNPYAFAFQPPYSMTPYGIVYYALLAVGLEFFGQQLWWGRLLTVLAFAACLWAIFKITGKLTQSKESARVACLVGLSLFPAHAWIASMRSDLIGLAFAITAVCLVLTAERVKSFGSRRLAAVILLALAAVFTKHTFLLPLGIIGLRFGQLGKWREMFVFGAAVSILTALGMFFLNYGSDGGYMWQHFVHAQRLPFTGEKLTNEVFQFITTPTNIVFGVFLLIFAAQNREFFARPDRRQLLDLLSSPKLLIWVYLFLSFAAASLSAGRTGANVNYYLENSVLIAIAGGLIYENFRRKGRARLALAMIAAFVLGGAFQLVRFARGEYFRWRAASYFREISETAARFTPPGSTCFSVYVELVTRNGCAFYFDDYGEYIGEWSPELNAIFKSEVRAGRFAVVIWKKDDFQQEFPNYELKRMSQSPAERIIPVYLYVRKTESAQ